MRWVVFTMLVVGCGNKDEGPPCGKVVDHMLEVMKELPSHEGMAMGNRKQMIGLCEQKNYTADEKRCLITAKDLTAIAACRPATPPAK